MNVGLIFAGGVGSRMHSKGKPKQFLEMNGKPILIHTIEIFDQHPQIDAIVLVSNPDWLDYSKKLLSKFDIKKVRWVVPGGSSGQESIFKGLKQLKDAGLDDDTVVLIHDGVRPLIQAETITDNIESVKQFGNAVTVIPAQETIVTVDGDGMINSTNNRSASRIARAPQSFLLKDIYGAHEKVGFQYEASIVDSATLMMKAGVKLHTVDGPIENIKITTPSDFYIFRAILEVKENSQIWGM